MIQKRNERGGLQLKSRVNGVVESENKLLKSRGALLAEKTGRCVWDTVYSEERETVEYFILHCP